MSGVAKFILLPSREKVAPKGSDEGPRRRFGFAFEGTVGKVPSTPHPSLRDTFFRGGRRNGRVS
jgi:hypothetical protein